MFYTNSPTFEDMSEEKLSVPDTSSVITEQHVLYSEFLERDVVIDVYLPVGVEDPNSLNLLLINDGQDLPRMPFEEILDKHISSGAIEPLLCIGIYCGPYRDQEYGTICRLDYKGRGAKAGLYSKFIFDELLPFIKTTYHITSFKEKSFAGFSLGGLSALDIVWNYSSEFLKVGVFSGSLWWRRKGYDDGYDWEKDRIMHLQVKKGMCHPWLKFFIQTGQLDETADRNNNGVIDSIDDALDLISALKQKGYSDKQIKYLELEDGSHNVETWARAFPEFLKWCWGKEM